PGRALLGTAPDLADEDDAVRVRVRLEELEHVDEVHAAHGVSPDADARGLPDAERRELPHGLVRERPRARDDAHVAGLVDVPGHDANLAGARRDDPGAVRADEA